MKRRSHECRLNNLPCNASKLERIANGEYLVAWFNRESYYKDLFKYDCGYWSVYADHGCKCAIDSNIKGFDNITYEG